MKGANVHCTTIVRIISIRSVGAVWGWSGDSFIGWLLSVAQGRLGMGGVGDAWAGWRLSVARAGGALPATT